MHIVFISREYIPTLRGGGIASYIKETSIGLVKRGHRVTVCCASDDTKEELEYDDEGIHVIRLSGGDFIVPEKEKVNFFRKFRCLYRFYSYRKKILKKLETLDNVDIIEVAEFGAEAFYLSKLKVPIVIRLHTPTLLDRNNAAMKHFHLSTFYEYWVGRQELRILPQFRYITACSQSLKSWFEKYVPQIKSKIEIIYNSIDIEQWKQNDDFVYEENTILFVGTVAEEKGIGDLIDACNILRGIGIPVSLKIAGKLGSYALNLKREIINKGYDWCVFLGNQSRDSLKSLYAQSKIVCFPSWWDNFPLVCLEAMIAGNIVIGSSNGGMLEIITDGIDGYLVEPHAPQILASCLERALKEDKDSVSVKRRNAYRKVKEKFSNQIVLNSLEAYYLDVKRQYENTPNIMG